MKWTSLLIFTVEQTISMVGLRYDANHVEYLSAQVAQLSRNEIESGVPAPSFSRVSMEVAEPISTTIVIFVEYLKLALSLLMCFHETQWSLKKLRDSLLHGFLSDDGGVTDLVKLIVPALLYTIQNNLQYVIESSPIFLTVYQLKLITTAIFYTHLLGRRITLKEWFCIVFLSIGVGTVQSSQHEFHVHHASNFIGVMSVLFACLTSGLGSSVTPIIIFWYDMSSAGVYFEKILKSSKSSIWVINLQLSLLSSMLATIVSLSRDTQVIIERGFFAGYDIYVVMVIGLQAITGLVVALVVKYSDNIHKGFAASVATVMAGFIESKLFPNSFDINVIFSCGAFIVLVSTSIFIWNTNRCIPNALPLGVDVGKLWFNYMHKQQSPSLDSCG